MSILHLENITKTFVTDQEEVTVLDTISLEINEGEFTVIVGPSGSGKSTLLRIIAGLIPPTSGSVKWASSDPQFSFVFQSFALFPFLTVFENIEFGLKMIGLESSKRKKIVDDLIEELELRGSEEKHPSELSGGMKQRVGIARALAVDPHILFLDEPFSALDEFTAENLRSLLLKLWQDRKMSIVMITHLVAEAIELADQIIIISKKPGTIRKIVSNSLSRPRNLRSAESFHLEDTLKGLIKSEL